MKKKYEVQVDITFGVSVYIEAESEEQAMRFAESKVSDDPMFYIKNGWHVGQIAICANEENV
jgi:hypothetical protein